MAEIRYLGWASDVYCSAKTQVTFLRSRSWVSRP